MNRQYQGSLCHRSGTNHVVVVAIPFLHLPSQHSQMCPKVLQKLRRIYATGKHSATCAMAHTRAPCATHLSAVPVPWCGNCPSILWRGNCPSFWPLLPLGVSCLAWFCIGSQRECVGMMVPRTIQFLCGGSSGSWGIVACVLNLQAKMRQKLADFF